MANEGHIKNTQLALLITFPCWLRLKIQQLEIG